MKAARPRQDVVAVTLSKRNLLALLAKVDDPSSHKTIFKNFMDTAGFVLVVTAEPDILHYAPDGFPPGMMADSAEDFIRAYEEHDADVSGIPEEGEDAPSDS